MASEKLRAIQSDEGESVPMDMSSMIDLVFQLIIFFMVSSHLIIVQIDKRVQPPAASNAQVPETGEGRIVLNVIANGDVFGQEEKELPTIEAIQEYVERYRMENDKTGTRSRINLRADKNVDTRAIKRVVKAAGEAGVSDIIFGSYTKEFDKK